VVQQLEDVASDIVIPDKYAYLKNGWTWCKKTTMRDRDDAANLQT
jgi:hypothetical protein